MRYSRSIIGSIAGLCAATLLFSNSFAAELEDKVVIYSTHDEALLEMVADGFTKETGVKVDFINLKGALADRVRAEKANPQSDVMYGAPSSVYMELQAEGCFTPYAPTWKDLVDPMFHDANDYWYGTIQTPVMIFYNTEMLSGDQAPKDWSDLAKPEYKDKLVFRNALSSSARATYTALLQQYEKQDKLADGLDYLKALDGNTKQYYGSGSLLFQAIGRKEAAISFAVLNDVITNKTDNNMPLASVDATSGSPVITDGIALINNAKHPSAAKSFINYAGSAKVQAQLANAFSRLPTNTAAFKDAPQWMSETKFKAMDVDWGALAAKQSEWMQKWDSEIKNSSKDSK